MAATTRESPDFDVLVIGAGWAGIVMCKYALEVGLSVRVLEARTGVGGVWNYSNDKDVVTVMKATVMSSSATVTEMSDFPMPRQHGDFPSHDQVLDYLRSYCEEFNLLPHIEFNAPVLSSTRRRDDWLVSTSDCRSYTATYLAVCSGLHQTVNRDMQSTIFRDFTGNICHSGTVKEFDEGHRDKSVLVVGGGETASDIVDQWAGQAKRVIWSIPNGQQFFRKYAKLLPHRQPQALDKASSIMITTIAPHPKGKAGLAWVCKWTTNGSLLAYQGHGIPEFRSEAPYLRQFVNKHAHVLDRIDYDRVVPKGKITRAEGNSVFFADGTQFHVDEIILSTGYKESFPFLPHPYRGSRVKDSFKYCLNVADPTLAYLGFARPVIGSIPMLIEFQCQMISHMWSGRVRMPDLSARALSAQQDREKWTKYFEAISPRLTTLVDAFQYSFDLMHLAGTSPDYLSVLRSNPRDFVTLITAPASTGYCRVNDVETRPTALANMRHHASGTLTVTHLILLLFLRLIWFDWIFNQLGSVKYRVQCSSAWKRVRDYRIVRAANHAWTWPKRRLFDNESHNLLHKKLL